MNDELPISGEKIDPHWDIVMKKEDFEIWMNWNQDKRSLIITDSYENFKIKKLEILEYLLQITCDFVEDDLRYEGINDALVIKMCDSCYKRFYEVIATYDAISFLHEPVYENFEGMKEYNNAYNKWQKEWGFVEE